eukprot:TRINITY_DN34517_c0_g1_i1.p1 TRINITY_DN34517_c0_g1~~TRINITY_DN34517_c0_g1_i1.p1  ORF type:complete len:270 (+),score=67.47 TRINITY_DN34517_c0_g1_i1:34-810(+)
MATESREQDAEELPALGVKARLQGGGSSSSGACAQARRNQAALETLAIRGTCIKDGGAVHACLLVPMRSQQQELLRACRPVLQDRSLRAVLSTVRSWVIQGVSPQPWRGLRLEQAMLKLQADRQLALAAVSRRGVALGHARPELRDDREVVLAAVRKRGRALEFASPKLQSDREVVLAALGAPGGHRAIDFAAPALWSDEAVQSAIAEARARCRKKQLQEQGALAASEQQMQLRRPLHGEAAGFEGSPAPDWLCLLHL